MSHTDSVTLQKYPTHEDKYLIESTFAYPVSFNGKTRFNIELSKDLKAQEVEAAVMKDERSAKYLEGKTPKKVIVVPGRIVNVVV
jgi:leucyl-tRNA synthetase